MIIFNEAKPKYEKLNELLELPILTNVKFKNSINIIVDLKEILKKFFRPDITADNGDLRSTALEISSDVINTIAHYRNYFYKNNKYSNFFILYSFDKCEELIKEYPNYKKDFYEQYCNPDDFKYQATRKAAKMIKEICAIIPHCKFVNTTSHDEFVYGKLIKENTENNVPILILSNDDVFFQLVDDRTFIIDLKGIRSNLITKDNVLDILTKNEGNRLSSKAIPLILALSGSKRYSLEKIANVAIKRAVIITEQLVSEGKAQDEDLIECPINFDKLDLSKKLDKVISDNKNIIVKNYKFIRADYQLYRNKESMLLDIDGGTTSNVVELREINDKFFSLYPINIDMLFKGEE